MALYKTLGLVTQTGYYLRKSWDKNASIPNLQKQWAKETLERFGFDLYITGEPAHDRALLLVGNHISYIDIATLMYAVPRVSFVAKKQVGSWPIFGSAAKAMNTVFVDRSSRVSRAMARAQICKSLHEGNRIVVFPSGTTRLDESIAWKKGAFEAAHTSNTRIQPFRIRYSHLRRAAYIDNDFFPVHLYKIASGPRIRIDLEFAPAQTIDDPIWACNKWYAWASDKLHPCEDTLSHQPLPP